MTHCPLIALKRKLDDEEISLPKRLRLARNVVNSLHFPTAPKERIIGEWLDGLNESNKITSRELKDILNWTNNSNSITNDLKCTLIKVVSQYLHHVPMKDDDVQFILAFIENSKITTQLIVQIEDFLFISINLLQHLLNGDQESASLCVQRIFKCIVKYYRESKKKLEFIVKFLDGEILETIFHYLHTNRDSVINLCQNILFPPLKVSIFSCFLSKLIRKDNIDTLIAEKGDNIHLVLKIMSAFFTFPKGRTTKDQQFLLDFIEIFVTCFKNESQLIFAFYIMIVDFFNMSQNYMNPCTKMPPLTFEENDEKIKRNMFLNMLETLIRNEVDISARLTDTLGERISKVEVKKNFMSLLQAVMMGILKLEGKIDKTSLQIINIALQLDPSIVESKMERILPHIMTVKKKNSSTMNIYKDTMNRLLETIFKLSRGINFISKIIPHLKSSLECSNVVQSELKQRLNESTEQGDDCEKLNSKMLNGSDILPPECVETYGRLTSELMFRQNKDLLISLQKDLEDNCLMMLEEGIVTPSVAILTELLSAILSSSLRHSKMADHTVPLNVAEDFWSAFQKFENECLGKFGECVLKLNYNPQLILAFLQLCLSFAQLKLLNIKYSNTKLSVPHVTDTLAVSDMSAILSCLSGEQWITLASKIQEHDAVLTWEHLLLVKAMTLEIRPTDENISQSIVDIKTHLIKQVSKHTNTGNNYYFKEMFTNIDKTQVKTLAKMLVKEYLSSAEFDFGIISNRELLQAIALETCKVQLNSICNVDLKKPLNKYIKEITTLGTENDLKSIVNGVKMDDEIEVKYVEILQKLQIQYLDESYQLAAIFVLILTKKCCHSKKHKRAIDNILQSVFELSPKYPDMYKLFPADAIFDFEHTIFELLTLTNKTTNKILVIRCILESAVKKVKTDPEVIKSIVDILLKSQKNKSKDMESFNSSAFQMSCVILPLIAKEKRAITTSAFRSILANLQEKINQAMLKSFKNIDFKQLNSNTDVESGNTDDNRVATLNAIGAFTLTLLKCCETTDVEEIKSLNCLWSGLEYFVNRAVQAIQNSDTKHQHVDSSIQLLNVTLRYVKKLESHPIFQEKDRLFQNIWTSLRTRLILCHQEKTVNIEEIAVTLKFLAELSSVECFGTFVTDLTNLAVLKKPSEILKNEDTINSEVASRKVTKYLWTQCLKANIVAPKCVALTKLICRATKSLRFWIQQHYEAEQNGVQDGGNRGGVIIEDSICDLLKNDLDILSEVIVAAKKISLDYKFVDAIFELLHLVHFVMGARACGVSWRSHLLLQDGCAGVLNSLLLSREELLEDRWPCYIQCYKTQVQRLCERAAAQDTLDRETEHRLAEAGHTIEKLTQSICKRKAHVSRISAYAVADMCTWLERSPPPKIIRQHLENSISLLIQVSDSTYSMAFLRRALAGAMGQNTMTNMYTMYKRYHKYVGNS